MLSNHAFVRMIKKAKSFITSTFPRAVQLYHRLKGSPHIRHSGRNSIEDVFSRIHHENRWGDPESVSGRGSTVARTEVIRRDLPSLLESLGAKSLLDAACGDFNWMRHVALAGVDYIGADVVPDLVACNQRLYEDGKRSFVLLEITSDPLPMVDLILCRDCLIHLSTADIHAAVANFKRSNSTFLLATTHTSVRVNSEIQTGEGRLVNLQLPPFNFAPPIKLIQENAELGKCLGLWRVAEL